MGETIVCNLPPLPPVFGGREEGFGRILPAGTWDGDLLQYLGWGMVTRYLSRVPNVGPGLLQDSVPGLSLSLVSM